jgi:hypothetical protein
MQVAKVLIALCGAAGRLMAQPSRIKYKYVSTAPQVATVQAQGIVSPVAPGTGKITIT